MRSTLNYPQYAPQYAHTSLRGRQIIKLSHFQIVFTLACLILIASCKTTVHMSVLKPAYINVPKEINNLAVINRYKPEKGKVWINVVEGALTGEEIFADKAGAEHAVTALANGLRNSPKFKVTVPPIELEGTGTGVFPPPLSSTKIAELCKDYTADAIITLESLDSDTKISVVPCEVNKKNEAGQTIKVPAFKAVKEMHITVGWRFYSCKTLTIIDEARLSKTKAWENIRDTEDAATANLIHSKDAICSIGDEAGGLYAARIAPTWIRVNRYFYSKGSDNMKIAKRKADAGDWEGAAETWNKVIGSPDGKLAAKACYSMALVSEVFGELQTALDWAQKAYITYGLKDARKYTTILKNRIYEQDRLRKQMEE